MSGREGVGAEEEVSTINECDASEELNDDEEKRLEEIEDNYWREFETRGTDYLVLLKGGRG